MSVESSLKTLSLDPKTARQSTRTKPTLNMKQAVVESWDEETNDAPSEPNHVPDHDDLATTPVARSHPTAPPPTPMSPRFTDKSTSSDTHLDALDTRRYQSEGSLTSRDSQERPEKTTTTASRMIAAGLGVKAPKRTEDQKSYDKAVREAERKKRDREKEDRRRVEHEKERTRAQMWDD
ncbi:MAG: hypothetical protein M1828_006465 [Chrysothrix sp. TS-e1954]|nr:MAG: hypothetical protein M1828_006465 [Chrysothrix sp. TS-e1954]